MGFYKLSSLWLVLVGLCGTMLAHEAQQLEPITNSPRDIVVVCQDNQTYAEHAEIIKQILLHSENFLKYTVEQNQKLDDANKKIQLFFDHFLKYTAEQDQKWNEQNTKLDDTNNKIKLLSEHFSKYTTEQDQKWNQLTSEIQDIKNNCKPKPQLEPLRFDTRCGKNLKLHNDGRQAVPEIDAIMGYRGALTRRSLRSNELFEVRFVRRFTNRRNLFIGVLAHSAENYEFPSDISHERIGSWTYGNQEIYHNSVIIKHPYGQDLKQLKEGDRVGVMRKADGSLHFFINGQDQGLAAANVPEGVYGFVDFYYDPYASVEIVDQK